MGLIVAVFHRRHQRARVWFIRGSHVPITPQWNDLFPSDAPEREHVPGHAVGEVVHDEIKNRVGRLGAALKCERPEHQDRLARFYSRLLDLFLERDPEIVFDQDTSRGGCRMAYPETPVMITIMVKIFSAVVFGV